MKKRIIILIVILLIPISGSAKNYSIRYHGKTREIVSGPKKIPLEKMTGEQGHDILVVAKSQNGYKGKIKIIGGKLRVLSYYGNIWANSELNNEKAIDGNDTGNWCSEFAAWSARKAGVKKELFPAQNGVKGYRRFFSKQGRFFRFSGNKRSSWFNSKYKSAGTMRPKDLQEGDILQIGSGTKPHHTAIFHSYKNGKIYTYDGNKRNEVKSNGQISYSEKEILAVIRPQYNDNLKMKIEREGNNKEEIRIRVKGLRPFTKKKRQYSITISNTDIQNYTLEYNRNSVLYNKKERFQKGKQYTVKLEAIWKDSGKKDSSFQPIIKTFTY